MRFSVAVRSWWAGGCSVEAAWDVCPTRRGRGADTPSGRGCSAVKKKAGKPLLVVDESEVRAALTASVEMDVVEVFVLEFRRVIAVGLDDVAEFGVASVEELFVHWLVAVRPNAQSLFDR